MDLQDKRIFLVEDNSGNQAITKTLLESHGAVVATQLTGHDVIAHLRNFNPIDLIILDLILPSGATGYDVFIAIRNQTEFIDIPIIAMSVADRSKVVPEAKKRGFAGFISKPINFQEFPRQIARIISGENIW